MSARGEVLREVRGNGLTSRYYYNTAGQLTTQQADMSDLYRVQYHNYSWDAIGNLTSRTNRSKNSFGSNRTSKEVFCYDGLNRLKETYTFNASNWTNERYVCNPDLFAKEYDGPDSLSELENPYYEHTPSDWMRYDSRGNITYRSGVGSYTYRGTRPHAVTSISDGSRFYYDNNGNVTSDVTLKGSRNFNYTTFDKPTSITKTYGGDKHTTKFRYGIDRSRYWRQDTDKNNVVTTTRYLGNVERITRSDESNKIVWKRYLGRTAIITITTNGANQQLNAAAGYKAEYIYRDHLGSIDVITDHLGNVSQSMSFDPWGGRRNADTLSKYDLEAFLNNSSVLDVFKSTTTRGFTGHEMLDEVGIIHMNGRIYDPRIARFLQADPIIQAATVTQSYNRYSYTWNNPLNATDPSGYRIHWGEWRQGVRQVVAIVVAVVATWACAGNTACGGYTWAVMAAASAFGAAINGAGGSGILRAAIGGAIMGYAGGVGIPNDFARVAFMGVAGGISSVIQGGKFGHGFVSGGAGAIASLDGVAKYLGEGAMRVGTAAIIGGTVSRATGGKFANGAFAAAVREGVNTGKDKPTVQTKKIEIVLDADDNQSDSGHFNLDQKLDIFAKTLPDDGPKVYSVVAHGDKDGMYLNGERVSAKQYAEYLSEVMPNETELLKLYSCNVANGPDSFAYQLHAELKLLNINVTIEAPTTYLRMGGKTYYPTGPTGITKNIAVPLKGSATFESVIKNPITGLETVVPDSWAVIK